MIKPVKAGAGAGYAAGALFVGSASSVDEQDVEAPYEVDLSMVHKKLSADQAAAYKAQGKAAGGSLSVLVERLLLKQANTYEIAFGGIESDGMMPEEAQNAMSKDGCWGAEAVSDRIVSFAFTVSGSDISKLAELKAAIDKGEKLACVSFGGPLPGICGAACSAVMQKLDKWAGGKTDSGA